MSEGASRQGGERIGKIADGGQRIHVDAEKYKRGARSSHGLEVHKTRSRVHKSALWVPGPLLLPELACSLIKEAQLDSTRCARQLWEGILPSYQSMVTDMTLHNHSTTHYLIDWHTSLNHSTTHYLMDWHTSFKHISLLPQFTTPTPHHPRSFSVLASNPSLPSRNETDVFLRPPITYTTERIHHTQQLDLKTSQREAMLSAYHDLHPFSPTFSHLPTPIPKAKLDVAAAVYRPLSVLFAVHDVTAISISKLHRQRPQ